MFDPNFSLEKHGRQRIPIEAKVEEIETKLRELIVQGITAPQIEPTPLVS